MGLYIYRMFCVDYLIANRDRHGSNLEVLRNDEDDSIRLAPFMMSLFKKRNQKNEFRVEYEVGAEQNNSNQQTKYRRDSSGMRSYDEHKLLLKNQGRCCQDEYYIEQI